ncbi:MAG TPA: DMT family transporter, partial [Alphaproteobacteria bacterium]|nr:DMT family transporter [Alphaproteobacteria bacterium]
MTNAVSSKTHFLKGVLPILAASALWALGYFARKVLLRDIPPLTLIGLLSALVAVVSFFIFRLKLLQLWQRFKAFKYRFIALSLTGVFIGSTLMLVGLDHLDLGTATLLEKLEPVFTAILAAVFLREKLALKLIPYCVLAFVSSYFISVSHPFALHEAKLDVLGVPAVAGAAFFWGVSSVLGRALVVAGVSAAEMTFMRFAITGLLALPWLFVMKEGFPARDGAGQVFL